MGLDTANNLINLIAEKERKEKQKRLRLILGRVGGILLVGGGLTAYWLLGGRATPPPDRLYEANQLTRSQVISLFEQSQAPILVRHGGEAGRIDTIHSPEEYTLYLAARTVAIRPSMTDASANVPASEIDPSEVTGPLATADIMPAFPGGEAALYRFLSNQIRYPEDALRNKIEGKVYIRFVVQADGAITDVDVLRGIGYGCDQEALRVVQMMPRWVPGELGGTKVPVYSSLAIEFKFL